MLSFLITRHCSLATYSPDNLNHKLLQEEGTYFWTAQDTGKAPRKTSWKMGNGVAPVEAGAAKTGAKYTEAEWQQMILGMKREHRENIEILRKEQDEALFKVRLFTLFLFYSIFSIFYPPTCLSYIFQIVQDLVLIRVNVSYLLGSNK